MHYQIKLLTPTKVISSIESIYTHFDLLPNLILHMRRAASVGQLICNHWQNNTLKKEEKEIVIAALLVHDIGNVVKMDLKSEDSKKMLGAEVKNLLYWTSVKEKCIKKYGFDSHVATSKIAKEIGIPPSVLRIIQKLSFMENEACLASNDLVWKICLYADQRVGPFGVLSLKERYADFRSRYKRYQEYDGAKGRIVLLEKAGFALEQQVLKKTDLNAEDINDGKCVL